MLMVWDEVKRERNLQAPPFGHGLDFADARDRFEWGSALVRSAKASVTGSPRMIAVGFLDGRLVTLIYTPLGVEAVSAISLRRASNRERKAYAAAQP